MIQIKMQFQTPTHRFYASPVDDAVRWCNLHFGEIDPIHDPIRWGYIGMGVFTFRHEEDAVLFGLRWA